MTRAPRTTDATPPRVTIFAKLAAAFLIVAVLVTGFAWFAIRMHRATVEDAAEIAATQVANAIAFDVVKDEHFISDLQGSLETLYVTHARDVTVVDLKHTDLADSDPNEVGTRYRGDRGEVAATLNDGRTRTFIEQESNRPGTSREIVVPVRNGGAGSPIVGAVILEYTPIRDELLAAGNEAFDRILEVGMIVVGAVALFGLAIARRITRPIRELSEVVARIRKRDYAVRVQFETQDELGVLGRAFNEMVCDLELSRAAVLAHQSQLEARVAERTQELHQSNHLLQEQVEQRSWEANHDVLTGLVNRSAFERRVDEMCKDAAMGHRSHILACLDLDRFKVINDTCGHAGGDEFLRQLATLLKSHVRASDTLARLGGDEFGLLLEGCSIEHAQRVTAQILAAVQDFRFVWDTKVFTVGVSIGVAAITADLEAAEALGRADMACYWAKEQGRGRVSIYRTGDADMAARRREVSWVSRLNKALDEDRFVLYHQSYLALAGNAKREHLEVLLRLIDEDGRIVPPGSFIPAAERYHLMPAIDRWVVQRVFENYRQLLAERQGRSLTCAINLSGTSINAEGFLDFIRVLAIKHALPPRAICFEITETVAINDLRHASEFMRECKSMGFLFALDDFGTGTSSFGYLKTLPVDFLKIDGAFVKNLASDEVDKAMTETINRIGHIMGIETIAEFAENAEIIDELRTIGVDYAQGYGVNRPSPLLKSPASERLAA